ncbi:hypothetical protein IP88_11515 [alpha proteobacterium AAP81b]|nr:hypothetical protein IP88_11515 [alpha proteobacterium AAP81b]
MFATIPTFSHVLAGAAGALFFTGACLSVAAGPANAETATATRSEVVRTADLNLAAPAGRATFDARVRAAATRVCGSQPSDLASRAVHNDCVKSAIAGATAAVATQVSTAAPSAN